MFTDDIQTEALDLVEDLDAKGCRYFSEEASLSQGQGGAKEITKVTGESVQSAMITVDHIPDDVFSGKNENVFDSVKKKTALTCFPELGRR